MMIQCSMQMQKNPVTSSCRRNNMALMCPPTTKEEVHIYAYQHNCNNLPTRRREQEDFNNGHKISVQNRVIFHNTLGFLLLLVPIVEADKKWGWVDKNRIFIILQVASALGCSIGTVRMFCSDYNAAHFLCFLWRFRKRDYRIMRALVFCSTPIYALLDNYLR